MWETGSDILTTKKVLKQTTTKKKLNYLKSSVLRIGVGVGDTFFIFVCFGAIHKSSWIIKNLVIFFRKQ